MIKVVYKHLSTNKNVYYLILISINIVNKITI